MSEEKEPITLQYLSRLIEDEMRSKEPIPLPKGFFEDVMTFILSLNYDFTPAQSLEKVIQTEYKTLMGSALQLLTQIRFSKL